MNRLRTSLCDLLNIETLVREARAALLALGERVRLG
jgi:hypothetical protein